MMSSPAWCFAIEQEKRIEEAAAWLLKLAVVYFTAWHSLVLERNSLHGSLRDPFQCWQLSKERYYIQCAAVQ